MAITWRRPLWADIEQNLSIQPKNCGNALVDPNDAFVVWQQLFRYPFFGGAVVDSTPPIQGHRVVGFGCGVFVSSEFADSQITNPQPDINSRLIAFVRAGHPVLPTREVVAQSNAGHGIDILILYGSCIRNEILNAQQKQDALSLLASTFVDWRAGFRLRRIICETADEHARRNVEASVVFQTVADFPEVGRTLHCMNQESANTLSSSYGNVLFRFSDPVLGLRDSDQQLLTAALHGATDEDLAVELAISPAAVKARWRSAFTRIAESLPELVSDGGGQQEGRGKQKRHRVLAYMRMHPEELRPYHINGTVSSRSAPVTDQKVRSGEFR
jgi:hypothetical protein